MLKTAAYFKAVWQQVIYCSNIVCIMTEKENIVHHSSQKWLIDPRSFSSNVSYRKASLLTSVVKCIIHCETSVYVGYFNSCLLSSPVRYFFRLCTVRSIFGLGFLKCRQHNKRCINLLIGLESSDSPFLACYAGLWRFRYSLAYVKTLKQ